MSILVQRLLRSFSYVRDLERRAFCDDLTGLLRRGKFFEIFTDMLASNRDVGVVYIDLNGFKSINDNLGHAVGDALLREFAHHAATFFGKRGAILGRMGGDEFIVAIKIARDDGEKFLQEMSAQFVEFLAKRPFMYRHQRISFDFSCGIATTRRNGRDPDMLLSVADEAMFAQKRRIRHGMRRR